MPPRTRLGPKADPPNRGAPSGWPADWSAAAVPAAAGFAKLPSAAHLDKPNRMDAKRRGRKRVKRTITITQKPPYPTIGECLRFIVGAFDLRGHGDAMARKRLDRLANEGDYDWTLYPTLIDQLILQPLAKCTDGEFAAFATIRIGHIRDNYISVIGNISLDVFSREEALPALVEHYFIPMASGFLQRSKSEFGGPDLSLLLAPPATTTDGSPDTFNPMEAVLHWFIHAHTGEFEPIPSMLYDNINDFGRTKRDQLSRHLRRKQIPDTAALLDVVHAAKSRAWLRPEGPTPKLLRRWLFIARALVWAESQAAPTSNLRSGLFRQTAPDTPHEFDIGLALSSLVSARGSQLLDLSKAGLLAFHRISTRQRLTTTGLAEAIVFVEQFRHVFQNSGQPEFARYMLLWCEARQATWQGNRLEALRLYELAADLALYRAGREMKKLLLEAILMAAECRKKTVYTRLMGRAAALHVFTYPLDGPISDIPTMEGLSVNFPIYFPHVPAPGQSPQLASEADRFI